VDPSAASWPSGTIKIQVEHILDKLGSTDRAQAAVRAVELGIVHGEDGALAAAGDRWGSGAICALRRVESCLLGQPPSSPFFFVFCANAAVIASAPKAPASPVVA
jgi:hypothetical protein